MGVFVSVWVGEFLCFCVCVRVLMCVCEYVFVCEWVCV